MNTANHNTAPAAKKLMIDGLWKNNAVTAQVLGLCPLLAVSNTFVNALALGLATLVVLTLSNTLISATRHLIPHDVRLPVFVLIIAALVTIVEFIMQAVAFELYLILGIFLPLITTNCIVLGRAEAFANRNPVRAAFLDGFWMGVGFALVLVALGAFREIIGQGTLFANMDLLLGDVAQSWNITFFGDNYRGFLFVVLPPGAFIALGLLMALKNTIDRHYAKQQQNKTPTPLSGQKRVRTTGVIK